MVKHSTQSTLRFFRWGLISASLLWFPAHSLAGDDSLAPNGRNSVGFSIGTPALINLELGTVWNSTNLRISGMYTHDYSGVQVGLAPFVRRGKNGSWDIALVAGHFKWLDVEYQDKYGVERFNEWNYFGLETMLSWKIFFVAPGLSAGNGDYNGPFGLLRLGAMYSFD